MKKLLSLGLLCSALVLAGCASHGTGTGTGGGQTEVYGQLKGGVESSHTGH
ncbi:YgdI/YgdR family lipoprotein [Snodgrassella communis]|uniref:YgdI/YgdR family lipoprotein n=1 Tax=Snodgrassella communis TaxID=2946699 RepID=UPI001EF6210C|nr:YgdI/YgdR family lipoprotein [Snodgrassella communis]